MTTPKLAKAPQNLLQNFGVRINFCSLEGGLRAIVLRSEKLKVLVSALNAENKKFLRRRSISLYA